MSEHHHRGPWAVCVGPERDHNGEPYELRVRLADERHLTEQDAEWLRGLIREALT